jgi:hypothetical protein
MYFEFRVIFRQIYDLKKISKNLCQPGFEPGLARQPGAQPLGYDSDLVNYASKHAFEVAWSIPETHFLKMRLA